MQAFLDQLLRAHFSKLYDVSINMNRDDIFELVTRHICEVIPELEGHSFKQDDQLKELGANSIDRAEIVMMTMEALSLQIPRVELAEVTNIGELTDALYEKSQAV